MSTRKTILVHGGMAAGVLAVVGYALAQGAGMWLATQAAPRTFDAGNATAAVTGADELAAVLQWRLPITMAVFGFALVALGEGVKALWKKPAAPPQPNPHEAEMQRLLRELDAKDRAEPPVHITSA